MSTGLKEPSSSTENPRHIAIIMDGNNRWAKERGLPGAAGHKAGVETIRTVLDVCKEESIRHLTLFAFSSENWQRPPKEVEALMSLFYSYLKREGKKLDENGVRLQIVGRRDRFGKKLLQSIESVETLTENNSELVLTIAADYGGQWDIVEAARACAEKVVAGELTTDEIAAEYFQEQLCLANQPLPDLCIRTGGEHRISNFLLWQLAYTELYFTNVYWPDFSHEDFSGALMDYRSRQRRFGLTGDQVKGSSNA